MSRQDDTRQLFFSDGKTLGWAIGTLIGLGKWFEYRPRQVDTQGNLVDHSLYMLRSDADELVLLAREQRAQDEESSS